MQVIFVVDNKKWIIHKITRHSIFFFDSTKSVHVYTIIRKIYTNEWIIKQQE